MKPTIRLALAALVLAFTVTAGWLVSAQAVVPRIEPQPGVPQAQAPTIISGDDLGFRVEADRGGVPTGRLVVRVNGQWVEPRFSAGVRRLTQ